MVRSHNGVIKFQKNSSASNSDAQILNKLKYIPMSTPQSAEYDHLFKLLLIGNSGVGKSCMLMKYVDNQFTNNFYNTIGVDFKIKSIYLDNKTVKLQIWDTAGQDRFRTITCSYYRGAHGIIVVYDITDRESFESVKVWMQEIEKYAQEDVNRLLVANKVDMEEKRVVSYEEGEALAKSYKLNFIEVSAKNSVNIEQSFQNIARSVLERVQYLNQKKDANVRIGQTTQISESQEKHSSCC